LLVQLHDPDPEDRTATVEVIEDGQLAVTNSAVQTNWQTTLWPSPGKHYYYVRITQADGDKIRSAPVWVTVAPAQAPAASSNSASE
jgi:hypothetical protein